jgi:hypothetical protein
MVVAAWPPEPKDTRVDAAVSMVGGQGFDETIIEILPEVKVKRAYMAKTENRDNNSSGALKA